MRKNHYEEIVEHVNKTYNEESTMDRIYLPFKIPSRLGSIELFHEDGIHFVFNESPFNIIPEDCLSSVEDTMDRIQNIVLTQITDMKIKIYNETNGVYFQRCKYDYYYDYFKDEFLFLMHVVAVAGRVNLERTGITHEI
jgi:hypothetical protein